jgi:hypothetical protein
MPIESHEFMWNHDHLHLSAAGYDGVAELVFRAMSMTAGYKGIPNAPATRPLVEARWLRNRQ